MIMKGGDGLSLGGGHSRRRPDESRNSVEEADIEGDAENDDEKIEIETEIQDLDT
jgi:hypothetical protein